MSRRNVFLFGLAFGAWLNIWPGLIGGMWSFWFAYALVFYAMVSFVTGGFRS